MYFDENFFYKYEGDPKFKIGDEVYYYFNPAEHWSSKPNDPKIYKDVVKSFSVGTDSYVYDFEKNRHDNVDSEGYVGIGGYSEMIEEKDIDKDPTLLVISVQ